MHPNPISFGVQMSTREKTRLSNMNALYAESMLQHRTKPRPPVPPKPVKRFINRFPTPEEASKASNNNNDHSSDGYGSMKSSSHLDDKPLVSS